MTTETDQQSSGARTRPERDAAMARLSVAPMMQRTDRHFRRMMRALTGRTLLYTEMVTTGALIHGDTEHHLRFSDVEHPLALQLGGDDPADLAACARIAEDFGYDEVNLNVGCPSDRVQRGSFGACLMRTPDVVARAVEAMRGACAIPVTVKHRIGVDDLDRYEDMLNFVDVVSRAGCTRFTVHARKAWLQGLSPKENRTIPPLRYHEIRRLKAERPELDIELNGGVRTLEQTLEALEHPEQPLDAVMIGRAAYETPYIFAEADQRVFGETDRPVLSRHEALEALVDYVGREVAAGEKLHRMTRHMLTMFHGQPGTKAFKRLLSTEGFKPDAGVEVLVEALRRTPRTPAPSKAEAA